MNKKSLSFKFSEHWLETITFLNMTQLRACSLRSVKISCIILNFINKFSGIIRGIKSASMGFFGNGPHFGASTPIASFGDSMIYRIVTQFTGIDQRVCSSINITRLGSILSSIADTSLICISKIFWISRSTQSSCLWFWKFILTIFLSPSHLVNRLKPSTCWINWVVSFYFSCNYIETANLVHLLLISYIILWLFEKIKMLIT